MQRRCFTQSLQFGGPGRDVVSKNQGIANEYRVVNDGAVGMDQA